MILHKFYKEDLMYGCSARGVLFSCSLFISYAREDVEFAQFLDSTLKAHGLDVWLDEQFGAVLVN
jgi:hypothetical protein